MKRVHFFVSSAHNRFVLYFPYSFVFFVYAQSTPLDVLLEKNDL